MKLDVRLMLWWIGGLALAGLTALWLVSSTEWATRDRWEPPRADALKDPYFLIRRLAAKLGATVEVRQQLDTLPPAHATLLINDPYWNFLPERKAQLKQWVQQGGHLVLYREVGDDEALAFVSATSGGFRSVSSAGGACPGVT